MNESIWQTALRSMLKAIFAIIGLAIGLLFFMLILGYFGESTADEPSRDFSLSIVQDANGQRKSLGTEAPVILKLNVNGVIGLDGLTHEKVERQLIESREGLLKDDRVKAILLHINTPGGTVTDADGIYRALMTYKERHKVPVYAFVDGLCASGGMYISCAADKVYATDISMIGSIGVIAPSFFNVHELIEKWGIQTLTLFAGKGKDQLNPVRPWKADEGENMKQLIDSSYEQFVNLVTTSRPQIDRSQLIHDYGAKLFMAAESVKLGFIDAAGRSYSSALKELLAAADIKDDNYRVVEMKSDNWVLDLFKRDMKILRGTVVHKIELEGALDPALQGQILYLYRP